ncbi:14921_t:CDS:2, partial [Funneliformis mosseae]
EGLPLFLKVSSQQLHEIFVKNLASIGQCPCLKQQLETVLILALPLALSQLKYHSDP